MINEKEIITAFAEHFQGEFSRQSGASKCHYRFLINIIMIKYKFQMRIDEKTFLQCYRGRVKRT